MKVSDYSLDGAAPLFPATEVEFQKKTLELRQYAAQFGIGRTSLDSINIEGRRDFQSDMLMYRIQMDILSDKIAEDTQKAKYSYEVYKSPWQNFKDWYTPQWFKNMFPVRKITKYGTATVKLERYATYPKANIAVRKDQKFFEVMLGGYEAIHDTVTVGTQNERKTNKTTGS